MLGHGKLSTGLTAQAVEFRRLRDHAQRSAQGAAAEQRALGPAQHLDP